MNTHYANEMRVSVYVIGCHEISLYTIHQHNGLIVMLMRCNSSSLDYSLAQNITSYRVAFLSPDPVTMYLSSAEMSQHSTDDDSLDCTHTHAYQLSSITDITRRRCNVSPLYGAV